MDEFATPEHEEGLSRALSNGSLQSGAARSDSPERLSEANAAGSLSLDGAAAASSSPSNTNLLDSHKGNKNDELAPLIRMAYDTMLLNEQGYSGPIETAELTPGAIAAIDWLEESSLVQWDSAESESFFDLYGELQSRAREERTPQQYELAGQVIGGSSVRDRQRFPATAGASV